MAGGTFFPRRLVEQHHLPLNDLGQLVTLAAANVLVRPGQWKCCPAIMIEERGFPLHGVVAIGAVSDLPVGKLFSVNIFVAILTLRRRGLKIHIEKGSLHVGRFVTVDACGRPMRPRKRKCRFGVIEAGKFLP